MSLLTVTAVRWGVVLGASLAAAVVDVRSRRIPNALTIPLALSGILFAVCDAGLSGLGESFVGAAALAAPYILLFVFAGGGAGDAKMMAGIGAWLGIEAGLAVLLSVAVTGGVLGLLRIFAHRNRWSAIGSLYAWLYALMVGACSGRKGWALVKAELDREAGGMEGGRGLTIPYGPAIFLGVCIGAIGVHSWNG